MIFVLSVLLGRAIVTPCLQVGQQIPQRASMTREQSKYENQIRAPCPSIGENLHRRYEETIKMAVLMTAAEIEQPLSFKRYILVFIEPENSFGMEGGSYLMSEKGSCFLFRI